ncbi:hypothetical protein AJ80_01913 [Polytolypa hystricis UAMH7299]|uniref:Uncharacterized protein n=1 Tax=Polytolypa hystricis (strain UAMH7299) TaxID=1447883 RepID=A0A2B7YYM2_POLH7|nr:hypothetical protein AJ80_01913 [Polytolypa hystricis UAMH7299]
MSASEQRYKTNPPIPPMPESEDKKDKGNKKSEEGEGKGKGKGKEAEKPRAQDFVSKGPQIPESMPPRVPREEIEARMKELNK